MEDFYTIAELIRKFRTRTISDKEVNELKKWVEADNHRQLFNRLLDRQYETGFLRELRLYNSQKAYRHSVIYKRSVRSRVRFYMRVAAVFLLPLFAGSLIYWWSGQVERENVLRTEPLVITPGSQKAILTLTDGRRLPLGKFEKGECITDANTRLVYDSSGLSYELKKTVVHTPKNEIYVPRKGEFTLVLSDGTKVFLNSDSRMVYPVVFGEGERVVELEGEAYFEVARDSSRPFLVKTTDLTVQVLGTAFNVKCYKDDARTMATLVQGSVKVIREEQNLLLKPGEQVQYHRTTGDLYKSRVNPWLFISWKEGLFIFERQRLEDLFVVLSRWYDVQVFFERQELKDKLFTGDLKRYADIGVCLRMLELTNDVRFEVRGSAILVK